MTRSLSGPPGEVSDPDNQPKSQTDGTTYRLVGTFFIAVSGILSRSTTKYTVLDLSVSGTGITPNVTFHRSLLDRWFFFFWALCSDLRLWTVFRSLVAVSDHTGPSVWSLPERLTLLGLVSVPLRCLWRVLPVASLYFLVRVSGAPPVHVPSRLLVGPPLSPSFRRSHLLYSNSSGPSQTPYPPCVGVVGV